MYKRQDSYAAGVIIRNDTGDFLKGTAVNYTVSLGSNKITIIDLKTKVVANDPEGTKKNIMDYLIGQGLDVYKRQNHRSCLRGWVRQRSAHPVQHRSGSVSYTHLDDGTEFEALGAEYESEKYENILGKSIQEKDSGVLFFVTYNPGKEPMSYKGTLKLKIKGQENWIDVKVNV